MKKLLFLFILMLSPMLASADAVEIDGIYYNLNPVEKTAEVTYGNWNPTALFYDDGRYSGEVAIPESVDYEGVSYSVTSIGNYAFENCSSLYSLRIPRNVTSLGIVPFYGCIGLTSIIVEEGNTVYDSRNNCNAIIKTDQNELIAGCNTTVIPNDITSIATCAFSGCYDLTSVTIPNGVTSIGNNAFEGCTGLTSITIPSSVTSIGEFATFSACSDLTSIIVEEGNPVYDSRDNCNAIIKTADNKLMYACNNTIIPNSVTSIGDLAFWECSGLTSITIPNGVTSIGRHAFRDCSSLASITIPDGVTSIEMGSFQNCSGLTSMIIPDNVTSIHELSFNGCSSLISITIGKSVTSIGYNAFSGCRSLKDLYCYAEKVPEVDSTAFEDCNIGEVTLHLPAGSVSAYQTVEPWKNFKGILVTNQDDYRPFIEEGKVWKVGSSIGISDNLVKMVEYYYFDSDTIIDGKTYKQMMCQRYVSPDYPDYDYVSQYPSLSKVGAWYEENQIVYFYDEMLQSIMSKYDFFSIGTDDTSFFKQGFFRYLMIVGPKQTGGLKGFKGVYRNYMWLDGNTSYCTTWMEGVGGIDSPLNYVTLHADRYEQFLMSCTVGDEVIYLNDEYEDGATPEGARKKRFDFTHTIKIQPKSRIRKGEEQSLYGEYNDLQLGIHLDPLDDDYQVSITDESGKVVYEKTINAGNIVGLSIDISAYAESRYTVTVENSSESFTGEFETQTTGIKDIINNKVGIKTEIYNLQGQRLSSLQKGLNIVNGQKIYVK